MVFVGTFNEQEIKDEKDKIAVEAKMKETGLGYTNTKITKKGLSIWVCSANEMNLGLN